MLVFSNAAAEEIQSSSYLCNKMALDCELHLPCRGRPHLTTVLIIDGDLGFVFWLGHVLDTAKYSALPAKGVPEAALLVMQLDLKVEVLVVNLSLPGATDFIAAVHRLRTEVRVIGVVNEDWPAENIRGLNVTYQKPTVLDEAAKSEWLRRVGKVLSNGVQRASH
jgi:hypothetical protein